MYYIYMGRRKPQHERELKMMNGKFGVELECFNVPMQTVVDALNNAGIPAIKSHYSGCDYTKFQIKYDGSIQGSNGFEVVSPILEGEAGIATIRQVCEIITALGAQVNQSTGFHIHHNVSNWGIKEFRNLFKRFVKFEAGLDAVQPASRRNQANRYVGSLYGSMTNTSVESQQVLFSDIEKARTVRQLGQLFSTRYLKLNLQSFFRMGTVEFRHHSGTTDADKVENYIRLTFGMVADAQDHTAVKAFKEQYTAKVALDTMLAGMVRRNKITPAIAQYYKARATQLQGV
jgi:hypothetical protein